MSKFVIQPNYPALLLCEGEDEVQFLRWYMRYLCKDNSDVNKIQLLDFGGVNDLKAKLVLLSKQDNFNTIKRIAIIRDAERNWKAAIDSVSSSIESSRIDPKLFSSFKVYLLPGKNGESWENGTLEDLCVKIINNEEFVLHESCKYLKNVSDLRCKDFKRYHKNMLHPELFIEL